MEVQQEENHREVSSTRRISGEDPSFPPIAHFSPHACVDAATVLGGKDLGVTQASVAQKVEGGSSAAQLREAVDARAFLGAGGGPIEVEARVEQLVRAVRERAAVCLAGTANELLQLERQLHEARASLASVPDGGEALHSALQSIDACRGSLSNEGRRFQRLIEALSAPAHDPASWADFGAPLHPDGRCNDSTRQRLGGSPTRGPKPTARHPLARADPACEVQPRIRRRSCPRETSVATSRIALGSTDQFVRAPGGSACTRALSSELFAFILCSLAERAPRLLSVARPARHAACGPSHSQAELDELRQQILTLQTQNKRLASVFKGKIEEFRKVHIASWVLAALSPWPDDGVPTLRRPCSRSPAIALTCTRAGTDNTICTSIPRPTNLSASAAMRKVRATGRPSGLWATPPFPHRLAPAFR
eukprot:scaffold286977_cov31-Tisochrysis_lutea.AAC.1